MQILPASEKKQDTKWKGSCQVSWIQTMKLLCVDPIGKHQFNYKREGKKFWVILKGDKKNLEMITKSAKSVYLQAVTMIDPVIYWIEICAVISTQTDLVSNLVEPVWWACYPLPGKVIADRGNEFLAKFRKMIVNDYDIKVIQITYCNPQANILLEKVHQIIGNSPLTSKVQDIALGE